MHNTIPRGSQAVNGNRTEPNLEPNRTNNIATAIRYDFSVESVIDS